MVEVETDMDASMLSIMLCVNSFFCERDDRILFEDLNFELREGQVLQIKGSNGSGKTTLARLLLGITNPSEGTIEFDGKDVSKFKGSERREFRNT